MPTAFVTNLGGDVVLETAPDLMDKLNAACKKLRRENVKELPKYIYPDNIVTAAMAQRYAKYRIPFVVRRHECKLVWALDHQRESKKCIYGGALLLSERAAAERAAACVWKLSDREREIIASLGEDNDEP